MNTMDYNEAEKMIHRAAMVMSSVGKSLIPERADNSHLNLKWDDFRKILVSRMFIIDGGTTMHMAFNPSSFVLSFISSHNQTAFETDTQDFTASELLKWCEKQLINEGFKGVLHKAFTPNNETWETVIRRPHDEFLFVWLALRTQANRVLENLNALTGHNSQVMFSPQYLETVVHYTIKQEYGNESHAIEAGLSMAGKLSDRPFYFVRAISHNTHPNLSAAPAIKHVKWHTGDPCGAFYQIFDIEKFPSNSEIGSFMETVYSYLNQHALVDK
jgi:hypothetical protein